MRDDSLPPILPYYLCCNLIHTSANIGDFTRNVGQGTLAGTDSRVRWACNFLLRCFAPASFLNRAWDRLRRSPHRSRNNGRIRRRRRWQWDDEDNDYYRLFSFRAESSGEMSSKKIMVFKLWGDCRYSLSPLDHEWLNSRLHSLQCVHSEALDVPYLPPVSFFLKPVKFVSITQWQQKFWISWFECWFVLAIHTGFEAFSAQSNWN
jgi:hypothetical protein